MVRGPMNHCAALSHHHLADLPGSTAGQPGTRRTNPPPIPKHCLPYRVRRTSSLLTDNCQLAPYLHNRRQTCYPSSQLSGSCDRSSSAGRRRTHPPKEIASVPVLGQRIPIQPP